MNKIESKLYKILRWSEKWTKTDMVYLASGGFWLTLGQFFSMASSLLLAVAFANLLPTETYGNYKYILSIASILSIPTLQGINTSLVQAIARGYEGSLMPALKTKMKWGLLGGISSLALSGYYYFNHNFTLTICFLIAAVFIPLMESFIIYGPLLTGKKLFKENTIYGIVSQIISMFSMLSVIYFTDSIILIIATYFLSNFLLRFFFFIYVYKKHVSNKEEDTKTINYGKHLSLMEVIDTIYGQMDKILIFHFLGAYELAIYSFAILPPEQIKAVVKLALPLSLPKFAKSSLQEIKKTIFQKMAKMTLFLFIIMMLYILVAPLFYNILFPKYLESIKYSQIYITSILASSVILPYSALRAQKLTKQLYKINIISPLFQIAVLFVFVTNFGLMGAIISRIINRVFNLVITSFIIKEV